MKTKSIILLALSLLFATMLTACGAAQATANPTPAAAAGTVAAEGHVKPNADANLTFSVRGHVAEILVKEGQKVSKGDVLIRLQGIEQAQAALAAAQLALTSVQHDYDTFVRSEGLSGAQ